MLAVLQIGGHPSTASPELIRRIEELEGELPFETYFSLSCQNCPDVVQALNLMSVLNPRIRHVAIDGASFQSEVEAHGVMAVPSVFLNGEPFAQGRMDLEQILAKLDTASPERERQKLDGEAPYDVLVVGGLGAPAEAPQVRGAPEPEVPVEPMRLDGEVRTDQVRAVLVEDRRDGVAAQLDLAQRVEGVLARVGADDAVVLPVAPAQVTGDRAGHGGIVVDEHLRTSAPDVYAAGDVASYPDALLGRRRLSGVGFDLRLRLADLGIGLREFLFYAVLAVPLGLALKFLALHEHVAHPLLIAPFWIFSFVAVALPEEIFFRGWIQNLLERRIGPRWALFITSALFGLSHFNKRSGIFNWQYVIMAAIAGIFYGRAWRKQRRVGASAICHATVDTIWGAIFWAPH